MTANLRAYLEDERVAAVAARVEKHEGESHHYAVDEGGNLVISVVTLQHGVPLHANADALAGGAGRGVFVIPGEGQEVLVAFDNGDFEGEAYIVGRVTGSGPPPTGAVPGWKTIQPDKVYVIGLEVLIHNGTDEPQPLPTLAEFNAHRHGPGTFANGGGNVGGQSGTVAAPAGSGDATGTAVLKAS